MTARVALGARVGVTVQFEEAERTQKSDLLSG